MALRCSQNCPRQRDSRIMPCPNPSSTELSNRMNKRLETVPLAAVAALKQEARRSGGLLDLVGLRMINEVPGKPSAPLGLD